ncbi:MAG TPA: 23S rRNA (pseudouridine(1915)-N(3))-methyltransferase RlmH [Pyrinomonadaceae bacterium]|jgi:23S rRNA (pseudouridine1915-N3)-methyltransferase|nr:23S rRNA (pseudouridine(1915)-N(3))-methyltransferase RlmH [Pyrinomonadaceae bacterium]
MRFRFVWIGKTRDKNWRALQEDYLERLGHFARLDTVEIKESAPNESNEHEGKRILNALNTGSYVILLDIAGRQISSHDLAKQLENWQNRGLKEVVFVIGGQDGVSPQVGERADFSLSLSGLTFTHEEARVILLEQLYRAFTIINGYPYQK